MSTELEKLKDELHKITFIGLDELDRFLDRAYALGRSERGEKMPVVVDRDEYHEPQFQWMTVNMDGHDEPRGQFYKCHFDFANDAIADARAFWARFGVEIEVKE